VQDRDLADGGDLLGTEAELRRGAGTQFDADVVDALIEALADGDDGLPSPV
jgi:hypothetical protein